MGQDDSAADVNRKIDSRGDFRSATKVLHPPCETCCALADNDLLFVPVCVVPVCEERPG